ncbi:M48 family metalloprotease [Paractinoplanes durhamensis]|uniref:M48 family metalloprotease n=1 Tax=Paractinoplanes durhamensis TaxID=113563 RepID=UPI0036299E79
MSAAAGDPRRLRTHTDIRFIILVAAVLATGVFAFTALAVASPAITRINADSVQPCMDSLDERTSTVPDSGDRLSAQIWLANSCMRPFIRAEVKVVAAGLLTVFLLATALYLLHPWWLVRRRRMKRLDPGMADVVAELDGLARAAGLARPPEWFVAPYAAAHGGQAFGLPWRYRVCLDVGLLVRYDLDRDGFRSVVRHELAHLTNRDVGRTYLTMALWWSFVVVALVPFVAITLHPDLLVDPRKLGSVLSGSPLSLAYRMVALLTLASAGYLVRNSILRARETCADTAVARVPDAAPALSRALSVLPWPPRYRRWQIPERLARLGPHPAPADRVVAVTAPDRATGSTWWELAGLAFMVGLALNNVTLLLGNLLENYVSVGLLFFAMPFGVLVIGLLAGALNRPDLGTQSALLTFPAGLAGGFAAGYLLNLMVSYSDSANLFDDGLAPVVLSLIVLVAVTALIAAWLRSVRRRVPHRIVTVAAVLAGGPLIAVWFTQTYGQSNFAGLDLTILPATGLTLDWYRELARWLNAFALYLPGVKLAATPILAVAIVLLWAVPVLLCSRWRYGGSGPRIPVRPAVRAGLGAGAAALVVAVALPYLARAVVPADVRRTVEGSSAFSFAVEYGLAYIAVVALLAAAAAGIVAATSARLRPVLVPLTVTVTSVIGAAGCSLTRTMARCLALDDTYLPSCVPEVPGPDSLTVFSFHMILVWGAAAAIPAALAGAGAGTLVRRRRGRPAFARRLFRQPARWEAAIGLGLVAALLPAAAAFAMPYDIRSWKPQPMPFIPAQTPVSADRCLIGQWRVELLRATRTVDGKRLAFTGRGQLQTFRVDGSVVLDEGRGTTEVAAGGGHRYVITQTGSMTASYRANGTTIAYSGAKIQRAGTTTLTVDGTEQSHQPVVAGTTNDRYTCAGDRLRETPADPTRDYEIQLVRVTG